MFTQGANIRLHNQPNYSDNRPILSSETHVINNPPCSEDSTDEKSEIKQAISSESYSISAKGDHNLLKGTDQDTIKAPGLIFLSETCGMVEAFDCTGNTIKFSLEDVNRPAKKITNRWAKCKLCKFHMTLFRVVRHLNCEVAFASCLCPGNYWPRVIKRGSVIGHLSQPFDASIPWDSRKESKFNTNVWSNDFIVAHTIHGSGKLATYKWTSILEGDYNSLDLGGCKQLERGNIADCILNSFTISILWKYGEFLLPHCSGVFQGNN